MNDALDKGSGDRDSVRLPDISFLVGNQVAAAAAGELELERRLIQGTEAHDAR